MDPMLKLQQAALELLEYKISDLVNKREVKGGIGSVWALHDQLVRTGAGLDVADRRRLEEIGRRLRMIGEQPRQPGSTGDSFDDIVLGDAPAKVQKRPAVTLVSGDSLDASEPDLVATAARDLEFDDERTQLHKLASTVWWFELDRFIGQLAASLRSERDRYTARLLYATHRNLLRFGTMTGFAEDVNLSRFRVTEAIPARDDALVSVDDLDSLAEMVREIISTIMQLGEPGTPLAGLDLPQDQSVDFVRRVALAVAHDPYAGRYSLIKPRQPGSEQLRLAIQELSREWMREEERLAQRRELEQRLQAVLAWERHQKQLFAMDVSNFTGLINTFFDRISRFLPESVGGSAEGPQLSGGVLGARNPNVRLDSVPEGAMQVTVCTRAPVRFQLGGLELAIRTREGVTSMNVSGKEVRVDREFSIETGRGRLQGFSEGEYVHLRFEDFSRSLSALVAESLAAHFVLTSDYRTEMLTVLRILANSLVGEPQELVRQALARLSALSATAPRRRVAIEGFLRGSARAAGVSLPDSVILGLVQRFHVAMTVAPDDLPVLLDRLDAADASVYPLTGEPLTVTAGNVTLTIRQYRARGGSPAGSSMVVMLPGRTLGSFTDYLIEPLGNGTLICVRGDDELAVIYLRDSSRPDVSSSRA